MAKISLISAHRYYTETPHEFNILTSFLKRIWVQLSESFSGLRIGLFLWHLDQKIVFTLTVNFYCTRIAGKFDTYITSVFNVTHRCIQLVKPAIIQFYQWFCSDFHLFGEWQNSWLIQISLVNDKRVGWCRKVSWVTKQLTDEDKFCEWQNSWLIQISLVSDKRVPYCR